ncbi:hypothetical protein [Azospirillum sp. TSO35-2]|uniref:hypothetical protein n=1 Tax=Azospirillum sp. TSO35-2 TaxID=716796 RepID=UPI000D607D1C|nr:hypothetical protein [Azospirillum sp. TSO35-2]PWC38974.1 hypothetical protein TSO352_01615 [Azospirillum sp. TSO35-2]
MSHTPTRRTALTVLALAGALALTGCGKKPKFVDSPVPEGQVDPFPRTYPNPTLDPKPNADKAGKTGSGVQFP